MPVNKSGVVEVLSKAVEADETAGSLLIDQVVYDYINDAAEEVLPELEALYTAHVLERTAVAKRKLAKSYIESVVDGVYPDEDLQTAAEYLAGFDHYALNTFGKASERERWVINGRPVDRLVARNSAGRFVSGIDSRKTKTLESAGKLTVSPIPLICADPAHNPLSSEPKTDVHSAV